MRNLVRLLRKIRREIGTNLVYVIWCALKVAYYSIKPAPRRVRTALKHDEHTLRARMQATASLLDQATFYAVTPSDKAGALFEGLAANLEIIHPHKDKPWQRTVYQLAELATMTWDGVDDPAAHVRFLYEQKVPFFRYYPLNKGKNDHWEWYLVPWHRTYGALTVALLDDRLRPLLRPVWHLYDHWYRQERPWMTRALVGSNIAAVNGGYTLHALMGYLLHEDAAEKNRYLNDYVRHARRLYKALLASYDAAGAVAVPFEGVTYGGFWFRTLIILGLIQRALGLAYGLLDEPQLRGLSAYVWRSRTADGDFQTSGDSHPVLGEAVEQIVFSILAALGDPDAKNLAGLFPRPFYLADNLALPS